MFDSDLILVDKPVGMSSFDVIRRLRRIYTAQYGAKAPKMGHAGTLDPLASGLMLIGVGKGTKKLTEYTKLDKVYETEIIIGEARTTGDQEGAVIERKSVTALDGGVVREALQKIEGEHKLPVSLYSAIKKDGTPLYKRAHKAKNPEELEKLRDLVPMRTMRVYGAELLGLREEVRDGLKIYVATVRFHVGSGTYIRSLGEELGRLLGYPATLLSLRRTKVGDFTVMGKVLGMD